MVGYAREMRLASNYDFTLWLSAPWTLTSGSRTWMSNEELSHVGMNYFMVISKVDRCLSCTKGGGTLAPTLFSIRRYHISKKYSNRRICIVLFKNIDLSTIYSRKHTVLCPGYMSSNSFFKGSINSEFRASREWWGLNGSSNTHKRITDIVHN